MVEQPTSPQREEQGDQLERKLRKKEQRLRERLQATMASQAKALKRFQRAANRLEKRMTRVERIEGRLKRVHQRLTELHSVPAPDIVETASTAAEVERVILVEEVAAGEGEESTASRSERFIWSDGETMHETSEQSSPQLGRGEALALAREARAAAIAAEETARLATERAAEITARLEQIGTGRHLAREVLAVESEAARAGVIAQEAERAALEAERLAANVEHLARKLVGEAAENAPSEAAIWLSSNTDYDWDAAIVPVREEEAEDREILDDGDDVVSLLRVREIEEEEEALEAETARVIAEIRAAAAAGAEAEAEASSARAREARRLAEQAEQSLAEIQVAIQDGMLTGDEAESTLREAEREVTRANALLADAEANEEQARLTAMDAEAEAEVAEEMAHAAAEHLETDEDELDITLKIPKFPPQETV